MNALRQYFDELIAEGYGAILRAKDEGWPESGKLEFKSAEHSSGPMTKGDRATLAEALSGFANSDGGILVWGIDCRSVDGVDEAGDLKPIRSLARFASDLRTHAPHLVSPAVIGVEHIPVTIPGNKDEGFVFTFVPKSESEPHMAMAPKQSCYFYRSDGSFLRMPSWMVADRYSRRPQPLLEFGYTLRPRISHDGRVCVHADVGISNVGRGIALYPAIAIVVDAPLERGTLGLLGGVHDKTALPPQNQVVRSSDERMDVFVGGPEHVIHPGMHMPVRTYSLPVTFGQSQLDDISIRYELYCDGFHKSGVARIPGEEVHALLRDLEAKVAR